MQCITPFDNSDKTSLIVEGIILPIQRHLKESCLPIIFKIIPGDTCATEITTELSKYQDVSCQYRMSHNSFPPSVS